MDQLRSWKTARHTTSGSVACLAADPHEVSRTQTGSAALPTCRPAGSADLQTPEIWVKRLSLKGPQVVHKGPTTSASHLQWIYRSCWPGAVPAFKWAERQASTAAHLCSISAHPCNMHLKHTAKYIAKHIASLSWLFRTSGSTKQETSKRLEGVV